MPEGARPAPAPVFDEAGVLEEARHRTGLREFGDASFREPLRRLLASLDQEARLHSVGRSTQWERVVGLLVNRLRAEDAIRRYPEILREIHRPFVIVGLPRTGTTLLHRMIAADPRVHALLWWESRNPAPLSEPAGEGAQDPRILAAEQEVQAMLEAAPDLLAVHPMDAHAPDEEIMLLEHAFLSTNPEAFCRLPRFGAWREAQDLRPAYAYLLRLLQLLQWQKRGRGEPGERWVLKTPFHLGHMEVLLEALPDARVICTHRDPVQTIPSFASMIHTLWSLGSEDPDPVEAGRHWGEKLRVHLERFLDVRDRQPECFLDLRYEDLVRDPLAQVRRIYAFVGMSLPHEAEAAMRRWARENARDRRPVHRYTLERFGFSEAGIRRDFARYRERFIEGPQGAGEEAPQP